MSIYYAWVLAALFSSCFGWAGYHVADGFLKEKNTHPETPAGTLAFWSAVIGAVFFFFYLLFTGAPVSNLDKYYVSGASVLWLGFGVPLLAPVFVAVLAAIAFVAFVVLRYLEARLNNLGVRLHSVGASARLMLESASEYRAALEHVRTERSARQLPHHTNLADMPEDL